MLKGKVRSPAFTTCKLKNNFQCLRNAMLVAGPMQFTELADD